MKVSDMIRLLEQVRSKEEDAGIREAFSEACDILYDYDQAAETAARLTNKYERPKNAIRHGSGAFVTWQCPDCQNFIGYGNQYCHWCGRMLGWDHRIKKER